MSSQRLRERTTQSPQQIGEKKMERKIKVYFDGELECGAYIKNAMVIVNEDYTMLQLVTAIKEAGYKTFMTDTMRRLAKVI
jgi:hypothetical protein